MSRRKLISRILEKAELRASGLKAIDPTIDFGDAHNLKSLTQLIEQLRTKIDAYNSALSVIDSSRTEIEELETSLGNLTGKMLTGVAFKYGNDSREYEMAGGIRKSERIRKSRITRLKGGVKQTSKKSDQTA
ncbi:hypothetical protein [Nostoc sp.]|uniref:hypothetical protein n=1 Tax=Nostoc sp. TaxID=1180 RepID=UPI002FFA40C5